MKEFDVAIIGGGLAGLSSAIELAKLGKTVTLFEKKEYPFHKVCGEYISNECWDYIKYLGLDLDQFNLPKINKLKITTEKGTQLTTALEKGGFGISRYLLDAELFKIATNLKVKVLLNTTVLSIKYENNRHIISTKDESFYAKVAIGSYGKRSNIDKSLKRKFIKKVLTPSKNYVGVKYHIKANLPSNLIGLHFFKDGYCGISKVEGDNRFCICYLTLANNLKQAGSIKNLEVQILSRNKNLEKYLKCPKFFEIPEVISQVNFSNKDVINNHILMLGDASGLVVPLFGNGMSMAFHSANKASQLINNFLNGRIERTELENHYSQWWKEEFNFRLALGRNLQRLLYIPFLSNPTLKLLNLFPFLVKKIIKLTHGNNIKEAVSMN